MGRFKIVIIGLLAGGLLSCNSYLDLKPYGQVIPKTPDEFASLLNSTLYEIDYGSDNNIIGNATTILNYECFADNLDANLTKYPAGNSLVLYVGNSLNGMQNKYRQLYEKIRDCNLIIENMKDDNSELGKDITAASYTLRGVCYYNLLRWFCEPYVRENVDNQLGLSLIDHFDMEAKVKRSNMKETVKFIETSLKDGLAYNMQNDVYRFNADVAKAYLAKLYFWTQNWKEVIPLCEVLLDKYPLLSGTDYVNMVQDLSTTKTNVLIRSAIYQGSSSGSETEITTSVEARPVSKKFIDLFIEKKADIRYELSFNAKREEMKHLRGRVRIAEIVLMMAEAYAHLDDTKNALKYLNMLRSHRISPYTPYTEATLPDVDTESLLKTDATGKPLTKLMWAILSERQKELFMEGDRWFELKRNGRPEFWVSANGLKYTTQKFMYTAPIMQADVELVPGMQQNPDYEL